MGCGKSTAAPTTGAKQDQVEAGLLGYTPPASADAVDKEAPTLEAKLSEAMETLKAVFGTIDANGDGSVSRSELSAALEKDEKLPALIEAAGLKSDFYVMEQLDENADGRITWDEFQIALKPAVEAQAEAAVEERTAEESKAEDGTIALKPVVEAQAEAALEKPTVEELTAEDGTAKDATAGAEVAQADCDSPVVVEGAESIPHAKAKWYECC